MKNSARKPLSNKGLQWRRGESKPRTTYKNRIFCPVKRGPLSDFVSDFVNLKALPTNGYGTLRHACITVIVNLPIAGPKKIERPSALPCRSPRPHDISLTETVTSCPSMSHMSTPILAPNFEHLSLMFRSGQFLNSFTSIDAKIGDGEPVLGVEERRQPRKA